jgi:hypothetical protein
MKIIEIYKIMNYVQYVERCEARNTSPRVKAETVNDPVKSQNENKRKAMPVNLSEHPIVGNVDPKRAQQHPDEID